ncbi:MAG: ACT domain-containing protein [Oscillospiraceae bacterium]|nr:ACT domain-containing protein [Oscillospiraceae bacterium]
MLQQISVFVENKAGRLCAIVEALNEVRINIRAMNIADTVDYGIVRLVVNDTEKAVATLKEKSFTAKVFDVIAFTIPDKFGALHEVIKVLCENNINIEYSYSLMGKNQSEAGIVIYIKDSEKTAEAGRVLKEAGVNLITPEDVA